MEQDAKVQNVKVKLNENASDELKSYIKRFVLHNHKISCKCMLGVSACLWILLSSKVLVL